MNRSFDIAAVIGVGLLGGSLGLALKARGLARVVRGAGRRMSSLDTACSMGAIDEAHLDAREACRDAELVVICTPANLVSAKLDEILPCCRADAVVTDVASTKASICGHARRTWPKPLRFVGSHPMAGSEKFGPEHSYESLYEGSYTIVEPRQPDHAGDAHEAVCGLWRDVGSRVVELDAARHDALVARTSHIPHVVAGCLVELVAGQGDVRPVVGGGFRDTTRVAAGRPSIWRDICLTNREAILAGLDEFAGQIDAVRGLVERGDGDGLDTFFQTAQDDRREVLGE